MLSEKLSYHFGVVCLGASEAVFFAKVGGPSVTTPPLLCTSLESQYVLV